MFNPFRTKAAKKADALVNGVYHHLVSAAETAALAVEHAAKAVAVHEAAITFHHAERSAAKDIHIEAQAALKDVQNILGHDVVPAVEHAAEDAAAQAVADEAK